jgi:hypothetical protein
MGFLPLNCRLAGVAGLTGDRTREQLYAALVADAAHLARVAASQTGVDPERLLASAAASIGERA